MHYSGTGPVDAPQVRHPDASVPESSAPSTRSRSHSFAADPLAHTLRGISFFRNRIGVGRDACRDVILESDRDLGSVDWDLNETLSNVGEEDVSR